MKIQNDKVLLPCKAFWKHIRNIGKSNGTPYSVCISLHNIITDRDNQSWNISYNLWELPLVVTRLESPWICRKDLPGHPLATVATGLWYQTRGWMSIAAAHQKTQYMQWHNISTHSYKYHTWQYIYHEWWTVCYLVYKHHYYPLSDTWLYNC